MRLADGAYVADRQMSIFDYLPKPEKKITEKCSDCRYKVWLHRGGRGIQSCDRYDGCEYEQKIYDFEDYVQERK